MYVKFKDKSRHWWSVKVINDGRGHWDTVDFNLCMTQYVVLLILYPKIRACKTLTRHFFVLLICTNWFFRAPTFCTFTLPQYTFLASDIGNATKQFVRIYKWLRLHADNHLHRETNINLILERVTIIIVPHPSPVQKVSLHLVEI